MRGGRSMIKPITFGGSSASDEASLLELHLQKQLEEDVARIFDESIYSDLEVACGKLKILTHSCILKARTLKFYHKLETILHANVGRKIFDEIYSFISDAYTECDIQHQETEIITYLNDNLITFKTNESKTIHTIENIEETDVFLTPKCVSPYEDKKYRKTISSSPSTELTKEYYSLVPIDGNSLEKELIEQDVISNAFHYIIKTQRDDANEVKRCKPTSLSLSSSHSPKTEKHSNNCDSNEKKANTVTSHELRTHATFVSPSLCERVPDRVLIDSAYSPDSLVTDDPSSSSDYLSAAYACSPSNVSSTACFPQLNVGDNVTKMENIFTSSDSGLENTAMVESNDSHKDVTLTDISLTESTLHDLVVDDASNSHESSLRAEIKHYKLRQVAASSQGSFSGTSLEKDYEDKNTNKIPKKEMSGKSSKAEKQRQNEEIVIMESSSLSSETGSWESVFPPKLPEKDICEKFINSERENTIENNLQTAKASNSRETQVGMDLNHKLAFKSAPCFIDAASLVDEENDVIKINTNMNQPLDDVALEILPAPSQPVPCSTAKLDISPNDWSENNDNDSLEQNDKDPDSIQKDLSPTIFEMTPITEDSLCTNAFENPAPSTIPEINKNTEVLEQTSSNNRTCLPEPFVLKAVLCPMASNTPNNSIMSLKSSTFKQYESEESESDTTIVGRASNRNIEFHKYDESSPIISGEFTTDSHDKSCNSSISSAWIVDMSNISHCEKISSDGSNLTICPNKPMDKTCNFLKNDQKSSSLENCSKSRASVDSDSSERSSHKFYIDLSSMPDPLPSEKNGETESLNEKKNIFSMFIDIGENSTVKEMPPRLSSSLNTKKNIDNKKCTTTVNVTNDSIFEKYELLCNDPNISISEIISIPDKKVKVTTDLKDIDDSSKKVKSTRTFSAEKTTSRTVTTVIQEEPVVDKQSCNDLFVKLSDLDKPAPKPTASVVINEEKILDSRMTRSIPDNSWGGQNQSCTSRSIEVISSFHSENALSLNRLFPHLKNEFSRSMPGSLSSRTRSPHRLGNSTSPGDIDEQASDLSEMSSVQSSICRSGIENSTNEESSQTSSIIINCQSRLGQDLLRMFLEEIAPDVIVEVSGRRIKAHKCILSSRCQYFAGILSGGWVESAGNVISLPPFSYNVVHFALCHIYSGLSTIPDSISIVELATIADMLSLEGLKEAIMFTLKSKYCHHFHKPCGLCIAGVLECFPLSSVYGLDDLYHKCLKWITRYFTKVWPTKAFATLPSELLDKCFQQHIVNLSTDNLVDTVYGCGVTVSSLNKSRWAESVARMCRRLVNAAAHYAAPRLVAVLRSVGAAPPAPSAAQALDDCLAAAIEWAPPDEACRAYAYLSALLAQIRSERRAKPDLIADGNASDKTPTLDNPLFARAGSWRLQCEGALVRTAPRVVGIRAFKDLPPDLRKRLRELGCIMYGAQTAVAAQAAPQRPHDRKSRSAYHVEASKTKTPLIGRSLDIDHVRASFVPYASKPTAPVGSVDVLKSDNDLSDFRKCARLNPPRVRTTKAQEERAKFNKIKNVQPQDRPKRSNARAITFENTKPRYLEPRTNKENDKKSAMNKPLIAKMVSSSESSRNSSPIQARNLRASRTKGRAEGNAKAQTMSQDSLATTSRPRTAEPSTDSLSESQTSNKYATYTKTKHTKGSVESIRWTKCHIVHNTQPAPNNNKLKTKIPVYLNQNASTHKRMGRPATNVSSSSIEASAATQFRNKIQERKVPGSLMNATKSSSAKMVPKIVKDSQSSKYTSKQKGTTKHSKQQVVEPEMSANIPIMERSGTFLKDEPTFGDKTTNIDIDQ